MLEPPKPPKSIKPQELKELAKKRLQEAEILFANHKYEGTVYLCGYAVELALKARICDTLKWNEYPPKSLQKYNCFKIHDLNPLLLLSGIDDKVRQDYMLEWSYIVTKWTPEMRYDPTPINQQKAQNVLNSVQALIEIL